MYTKDNELIGLKFVRLRENNFIDKNCQIIDKQ